MKKIAGSACLQITITMVEINSVTKRPTKEMLIQIFPLASRYRSVRIRYIFSGLGTPFFSVLNGRIILFRSFKERNVLFRTFFEFLATYETQKERSVFFRSFLKNGKERKERSVLFKRTDKNLKNVPFFSKECSVLFKRTEKNLKNVPFF